MNRTPIRLAFAGAVLLYLAQFPLIDRVGEPYPALVQPGFEGTRRDRDGNFQVRGCDIVVTFANRPQERLTPPLLFAQAPSSHHDAMRAWFAPWRGAPAPETRGLPGRLARRVAPGMAVRDRFLHDSTVSAPMRRWLAARLAQLFPGRVPLRAEFLWYREVFRYEDGTMTRARHGAVDTVAVALGDAGRD